MTPRALRSGPLIVAALLLNAGDALAAKKWRTKEGCTLIENEARDGDIIAPYLSEDGFQSARAP